MKSCISSRIFWKNSAGRERKATESASNFYFDLLHFVITITKGLWCAHIQVQADLFSCCTSKVVIPSCSLLTVVCVQYLCAFMQMFHCAKWTSLRNESWYLHCGNTTHRGNDIRKMDIRNASGWKTLEVAGWKFSGKKTEVEKDISFHSGPAIKLNKEQNGQIRNSFLEMKSNFKPTLRHFLFFFFLFFKNARTLMATVFPHTYSAAH